MKKKVIFTVILGLLIAAEVYVIISYIDSIIGYNSLLNRTSDIDLILGYQKAIRSCIFSLIYNIILTGVLAFFMVLLYSSKVRSWVYDKKSREELKQEKAQKKLDKLQKKVEKLNQELNK